MYILGNEQEPPLQTTYWDWNRSAASESWPKDGGYTTNARSHNHDPDEPKVFLKSGCLQSENL